MKPIYQNKNIVVIGAGKSGQALVRYLVRNGAAVTLSDQRGAERIEGLDSLRGLTVRYDLGGHSPELFERADLVAVSPGVPLDCPPLARAKACRVPLWGEIEIASRDITAPMIGVTGTNGKSTTTTLLGLALQAWGKRTFVGGNLGQPLITACDQKQDYVVVELSSFQLETVVDFHPRIALLLNLSSDHLDRYPNLEAYYQAKLKLFGNMNETDFAVLNADDREVCRLSEGIRAQKVWFSATGRRVDGLVRCGERLVWRWRGEELELPLAELKLAGEHNVENAMAAMAAALLAGCPADVAWKAVCSFAGLAHRMQLVRRLDGVSWFNDSKGTNVGSVVKSLAGLSGRVILIAGGKDKGGDYSPLRPLLEDRVARLILIGEAAERMGKELAGACEISFARDLDAAVALAHENARSGDTVLLSPACSSYDMFVNYEKRGEYFEQLVMQLAERRVK